MTPEQAIALASARRRQAESDGQRNSFGRQAFSGVLEGATGVLGAPVDIANAAVGLGMRGVNSVFGTDFQPSQEPLGGSAGLRRGLAISPESDSPVHQTVRRVGQSVGGAAVPALGTARTAGQFAAGIGTGLGGGVGGAAAQTAFPDNFGAELAGEIIGGLGAGAGIAGVANRSARRAAEAAVPSVDQLKGRASGLYDIAEQQGITASQQQTQGLAREFRTLARREGLVSPTGRVSEAYPRAAEALRVMDDYATGAMNPTQMQTVRDVLADAVGATQGKERRIAAMMLDRFDKFTAPLAPSLAEARQVYSRAARGDALETLSDLAGSRAGQFTGSGYENALRTEYRNLQRRIIKGQESGWTPEQVEAIGRVANGTRVGNTARNIGRMAPTGPVSFMASAGVPAIVGNAIGGPVVGGALAVGTSLAGYGSRGVATAIGKRNAELAQLLARNGAPVRGRSNDALRRRIFEAIIGSSAATQPMSGR